MSTGGVLRRVLIGIAGAALVVAACPVSFAGADAGNGSSIGGAVESAPPRAIVSALRSLRDPEAPRPEALVPELLEPARGSAEPLVDLLAAGRVPELDGAPPQTLSEPQRELVLRLLERLPREEVLAAAERSARGSAALADAEARAGALLAVVDALGACAGISDVHAFFGAVDDATAELPLSQVEPVLERALASVLRRSDHVHEWLLVHWRELDDELLPAVLCAVGATRDPAGLELLTRVLEIDPERISIVLPQVRLIGPSPVEEVNERLFWLLRPHLDPERSEFTRAAVLTLGELRDVASIPPLAKLLTHDDRGLRDNALWALRRASGRSFPPTPTLWTSWYESERRWFAERFEPAQLALVEGDAARAAAALRELAAHRLHPVRIAGAIASGLGHRDPTVRLLACRSLAELDLPLAIRELRLAVGDSDPEVAATALAAYERLSGAPVSAELP